jgi:uncharacterized protein
MSAALRKQSNREARAALQVRPDGSLRIAVVSDTHGKPHPDTAQHVAALQPDAILHAGDVGDLAALEMLKDIAPVVAVRGNVDARAPDLPDVAMIDVEGAPWSLRILLTHFAMVGPGLRGDVARHAQQRGATLVVCGHSHVPFLGNDRGLLVFNPGSIGPRRFQLPIVFGVMELTQRGLELRHVDCETGQRWTPPQS